MTSKSKLTLGAAALLFGTIAFGYFAQGVMGQTTSPTYGPNAGTVPIYPQMTQNWFFASPSGVDGSPVFRAITNADLASVSGLAFATGANSTLTSLTGLTTPLSVAQGGKGLGTTAAPSITSCGTTGTAATGSTSFHGTVTFGASGTPSACTASFATAFANYASCAISPANATAAGATILPYISAQSKTAFTITTAVAAGGAAFNYVCDGQ